MNYQNFYREGFTPQSGIDTITIWLHPKIINRPGLFHKEGNNNQAINLRFNSCYAGGQRKTKKLP